MKYLILVFLFGSPAVLSAPSSPDTLAAFSWFVGCLCRPESSSTSILLLLAATTPHFEGRIEIRCPSNTIVLFSRNAASLDAGSTNSTSP
jgi:hypothetical protein